MWNYYNYPKKGDKTESNNWFGSTILPTKDKVFKPERPNFCVSKHHRAVNKKTALSIPQLF